MGDCLRPPGGRSAMVVPTATVIHLDEKRPTGRCGLGALTPSPRAVSEAHLRGIVNDTGVCGRFRYSDLMEAPSYGI